MNKFISKIRDRVIAGVVYMIPVFVVFTVLQKLFNALGNASGKLAEVFGLNSVLGSTAIPVITILMIILIFYVLGWLVRFSMMTRFRNWLENSLLQYIPGYLTYKSKMEEKVGVSEDARKAVLVKTPSGNRPGLIVKENPDHALVFIPSSPDTNNGDLLLAEKNELVILKLTAKELIKAVQQPAQSGILESIQPGIPQ